MQCSKKASSKTYTTGIATEKNPQTVEFFYCKFRMSQQIHSFWNVENMHIGLHVIQKKNASIDSTYH